MSGNASFMCPPRMSDGRHFTDYAPRCSMAIAMQAANTPLNSYEMRQFMITNAEKLMGQNRSTIQQKNQCGPCMEPWNQGTMLPEQSTVKCNTSTCKMVSNNANGLGTGRDYGSSTDIGYIRHMEAKNIDMRNKHDAAKAVTSDLGYYAFDKKFPADSFERLAVPSGAHF